MSTENGTCPTCGQPRIQLTSHSDANPNRKFVKCHNPSHFKESFVWVDQIGRDTSWVQNGSRQAPLKTFNQIVKTADFLADVTPKQVQPLTAEPVATPVESSAETNPLGFLEIDDAPVVLKNDFTWSEYQEKIFNFVEHDYGNGMVIARAGAAKTTSGVECIKRSPPKAKVAYVSFGADIVSTLKEKAPSSAHVSTIHALCFENARIALGDKLKFNEWKLHDLYDDVLDPYKLAYELKPAATRLVNGLKAFLFEPTQENMDYLIDRFGIEVNGDSAKVYDLTAKLLKLSIEHREELDYEDMVYWCAIGEIPCQKFDFIYQDEFQDTVISQQVAMRNSLSENGRTICFSDPFQSIYAFRFADSEATNRAIREYQATVLDLPISYRCPQEVIRLAQALVPDIQARPNAPEGIVDTLSSLPELRQGDVVLCRMNRYLVAPAFDLIRKGVKATILGRDVGNNLVSMLQRGIKKAGTDNKASVLKSLDQYVANESEKLIRNRKEAQAESLIDRFETLMVLSERCATTGDMRNLIGEIFSKDKKAVTFSTSHKFKGKESDRIFIIQPQLLSPQKWDKQEWQLTELQHLKYVTITRAKSELHFIQG